MRQAVAAVVLAALSLAITCGHCQDTNNGFLEWQDAVYPRAICYYREVR